MLWVGEEPNPVPYVRGADGSSGYTIPDSIIPERGQVSENSSHPETKQAWDVLHDESDGSNVANDARVFRPETRSLTFKASALTSVANVLAGEAAADEVHGSEGCRTDFSDIMEPLRMGPVCSEARVQSSVVLDLPNGVPEAGPFEAELKATDAGK